MTSKQEKDIELVELEIMRSGVTYEILKLDISIRARELQIPEAKEKGWDCFVQRSDLSQLRRKRDFQHFFLKATKERIEEAEEALAVLADDEESST